MTLAINWIIFWMGSCNGRNKGQKLVGHFLKIGHFIDVEKLVRK